jgi:hypothetical protein
MARGAAWFSAAIAALRPHGRALLVYGKRVVVYNSGEPVLTHPIPLQLKSWSLLGVFL